MRCLVIEDDKDLQQSLSSCLRSVCFAVDTSANGEEGLFLARTTAYDLIILDYGLPGKNSLEICQELRSEGISIPILILSVHGEIDLKVALLDTGADDYLTKPFSIDELLARLRALLRRPLIQTPSIIKIGALSIDTTRQEASGNGKPLRLTPKEFALLEYLAQHQNAVVSRGMIMEHVWDRDGDLFSNTIEMHMLNLRKKLAARGLTPITTIMGRGYRLDG